MRLGKHQYSPALLWGACLVIGSASGSIGARPSQAQNPNPDITQGEIASFDQFLDRHPDIDRQLTANPSLVNDQQYLQQHPALQTFFNDHPRVKGEISETPNYFMRRESRFDARERRNGATNPNPDLTRREVANFDQFLDQNRQIDRDLTGNPSLINNTQYLRQHPELQEYLNSHPNVKEEIQENPNFFMQRERSFDAREAERRNQGRNPNPDLTRGEVANFDQFLDQNRQIDRDLTGNPSLINNAQYLRQHPELQEYLNAHPNVKEEIQENPNVFMQRERSFDAREAERRNQTTTGQAAQPNTQTTQTQTTQGQTTERQNRTTNPNPDLTRGEVASFDQFLDQNRQIDRDLTANPSLINSAQYVRQHPELQEYLNSHPKVKEEIQENPNVFMQRERSFDAREAERRNQGRNPNPDLTRGEVANFDQFLDQNRQIDRDLTANPSLINSAQYVRQHPELQEYLNSHPNVKEEIQENPNFFMQRERSFDAREAERRNQTTTGQATQPNTQTPTTQGQTTERQNRTTNPNPDLTQGEVASFDQFLDRHRDIDRQLTANPSLINNQQYLQQHPELQEYLTAHQNVREEIAENPNYFMRRETQYDAAEAGRRRANPNVNRAEIASFDQFLDDHKDLEKDLQKNPNLVNDSGFLKKHKDLQNFLNQHAGVRQELTQNPSFFMNRENRFEMAENRTSDMRDRDIDRDRTRTNTRQADEDRDLDAAPNNGRASVAPLTDKDMKETGKFLEKHKKIDKDLRKNPELVNDGDYLNKHKDLRSFLHKNPQVSTAMKQNPSRVMQNQARFEQMNARGKAKQAQTEKQKTKMEQKEQARPFH